MPLVLIIDDEPGITFILERILQRGGYDTIAAPNGKLGLNMFAERHPNAVIIDEMMPDMRGGDVCIQIKQMSPQTPVILCSASVRIHDLHYIERIGADAALVKPTRPQDLVDTVKRLLGAATY